MFLHPLRLRGGFDVTIFDPQLERVEAAATAGIPRVVIISEVVRNPRFVRSTVL